MKIENMRRCVQQGRSDRISVSKIGKERKITVIGGGMQKAAYAGDDAVKSIGSCIKRGKTSDTCSLNWCGLTMGWRGDHGSVCSGRMLARSGVQTDDQSMCWTHWQEECNCCHI
mmetsp:Transcript_4081/g.6219  ORF Transcript_4081/g.6219 Transcript_4081/m.6219 type:complete len:114 (-) Transcript_4081:1155-1496(-)